MAVCLCFCLSIIGTPPGKLLAQDPAAAVVSESSAPTPSATPRKVEAVEEAPSALEWVEQRFGDAVSLMEKVFFHKLFSHQRETIQFDQQEFYTRPFEAKGQPLTLLQRNGGELPESLDENAVRRLLAQGKITAGIGPGLLDDRKVDFIAVPLNTDKYVLEDGRYRKELPMRQRLGEAGHDVLSEADVAAAAARGWLKTDAENAADSTKSYLITESTGGAPLVVLWLACGAVFFTVFMGGFNIWGFRHAIDVVRGKYDNPNEPGEVTHFQALASALSATVGLGNIAGVTIAMTVGGPGAFFWMLACGAFGMTSKFVECTLGQKYRQVKPDGTILGGPMQYLRVGLAEMKLKWLGVVLSLAFAVMCIMASFGGGNMFQANQSGQQMLTLIQSGRQAQLDDLNLQIKTAANQEDDNQLQTLHAEKDSLTAEMKDFEQVFIPGFGLVLAFLVGIVIIGGIKRIAAAAEKIVPTMCIIYMAACLYIIVSHVDLVPGLVVQIFSEAFHPQAFGGGLLGVLVVGVQRAAFSNEAGVGSAAIAHSAAKTTEPVREGAVALLGPFIDTIVVCSMTALVILITGAWNNEQWVVEQGLAGTPLTSKAFGQEISWFPAVLSVAVVLFAYSSMISWSYYGEKCWEHLFGARSTMVYKTLYVGCAFLGTIVNLGAVLDFSDMMILTMAFPNILGLILLSPKVRADLRDYWRRYEAGEFKKYG